MLKRSTMLKRKKDGKDKAQLERTDAVAGHGPLCTCIRHRAQQATGGRQA